jgi:hypothetical protein
MFDELLQKAEALRTDVVRQWCRNGLLEIIQEATGRQTKPVTAA